MADVFSFKLCQRFFLLALESLTDAMRCDILTKFDKLHNLPLGENRDLHVCVVVK